MKWLIYIYQKMIAWKHGWKHIGKPGQRGRIYEATAKPRATISARVFRAKTGKWEDHGVIVGKKKE